MHFFMNRYRSMSSQYKHVLKRSHKHRMMVYRTPVTYFSLTLTRLQSECDINTLVPDTGILSAAVWKEVTCVVS